MQYTITYSKIRDKIRFVSVDLDGRKALFVYNKNLNHTTVKIKSENRFEPDMDYVDGQLYMTFPYTIITAEDRMDFMHQYEQSIAFCKDAEPLIKNIINSLEKGETFENNLMMGDDIS